MPGEILVQLRAGTGNLERDAALRRISGRLLEHVMTKAMERDREPGLLRVATTLPIEDAIAKLQRDPEIAFAEPNWLCRSEATSNDPEYILGNLWGTYSDDAPTTVGPANTTNPYGTQVEKAWASGETGSRTVYVGVIDEGVEIAHPDLAANAWTNPFDPIDGVDNDQNGYIDDVHGWDFIRDDNSVYDGVVDDHGTHVAGIVGGVGGNGVGVAGTCWSVSLVPVKSMEASSGPVSAAIRAMDYVTDLKTRHGLDVVATNNSWSTSSTSYALHDAVLRAAKQGILTVAAAGNAAADNDSGSVYPANLSTLEGTPTQSAASYEAVLSVAAIDRYGALASFSNYGATKVDLGAPGVAITSTVPPGDYGSWSGTSMAAPHVSGAAALYAAAHPGTPASEIRAAILASATPTASLAGKVVTGGRLEVGSWFAPPAPIHDVTVEWIAAPVSVIPRTSATVTVTVRNDGTASESFTVSVIDTPPEGGTPGSLTAPMSVTLAPGASTTRTFTWDTMPATTGIHVLRAAASAVAGEADLADNTRTAMASVEAPRVVTMAAYAITPSSMPLRSVRNVVVAGQGFRADAQLSFANGAGSPPTAASVVVAADGRSLTAAVTAPAGPPSTATRWDVVVTNPGGRSASLRGAFRIEP